VRPNGMAQDGAGVGQFNWHSGPVNPDEIRRYLRWVLEEFDGSLVESRSANGEHYHVEVTRLEDTEDGQLEAVEGANVE